MSVDLDLELHQLFDDVIAEDERLSYYVRDLPRCSTCGSFALFRSATGVLCMTCMLAKEESVRDNDEW